MSSLVQSIDYHNEGIIYYCQLLCVIVKDFDTVATDTLRELADEKLLFSPSNDSIAN